MKKLTGEYGFCQTYFDNARIPADCLMGQEGEGWNIAMVTLTFERGTTDGQAGGIASMTPLTLPAEPGQAVNPRLRIRRFVINW